MEKLIYKKEWMLSLSLSLSWISVQPRVTFNLGFFCFNLQSTRVTGVCHNPMPVLLLYVCVVRFTL